MASQIQLFSTFFLGNLCFGVDVERIQEFMRYQEMTRVPLAPKQVKGLINLRGQIVTAIDLRLRLNLEVADSSRLPMNVVVRTEEGPISLLVDKIGDVLEVNPETFETPPDTLQGTARELILGAYKLENRLLLILDIDKALDISAIP